MVMNEILKKSSQFTDRDDPHRFVRIVYLKYHSQRVNLDKEQPFRERDTISQRVRG
jgi:hypothetical protein